MQSETRELRNGGGVEKFGTPSGAHWFVKMTSHHILPLEPAANLELRLPDGRTQTLFLRRVSRVLHRVRKKLRTHLVQKKTQSVERSQKTNPPGRL